MLDYDFIKSRPMFQYDFIFHDKVKCFLLEKNIKKVKSVETTPENYITKFLKAVIYKYTYYISVFYIIFT